MTQQEKATKALGFFKDWSNYLLVTTVAALGWASKGSDTKPAWVCIDAKPWCIWFLALSIMFGIFTLALIPLVQEQRRDGQSNHAVKAKSWLSKKGFELIWVCMPQHVLFVAGIIAYAIGTTDVCKLILKAG